MTTRESLPADLAAAHALILAERNARLEAEAIAESARAEVANAKAEAAMATLIMTAKLNDIDPRAWLANVLGRIADQPANRLDQLLSWNWSTDVRSAAPPQAA